MSVICHNFVQNAWKKDLCSNCFKSSAEHAHTETKNDEILNFINSGVTSPLTGSNGEMLGRYMSQATTIYQSRNLLNSQSRAWPSLIIDQKVKGQKLANITMKLPATCITQPEVNAFNSTGQGPVVEKSDECEQGEIPDTQGIIKNEKKEERLNVKFFEEEAMVIGYGGHDYDPNDPEWELASDDGDEFVFDLMDDTAEERIITRMTKENTEFNSDSNNLLKDPSQEEEVHVTNVKNAISKLEGLNCKSTDDKSDVGTCKTTRNVVVAKSIPANSKFEPHDVTKAKEMKPTSSAAEDHPVDDTKSKSFDNKKLTEEVEDRVADKKEDAENKAEEISKKRVADDPSGEAPLYSIVTKPPSKVVNENGQKCTCPPDTSIQGQVSTNFSDDEPHYKVPIESNKTVVPDSQIAEFLNYDVPARPDNDTRDIPHYDTVLLDPVKVASQNSSEPRSTTPEEPPDLPMTPPPGDKAKVERSTSEHIAALIGITPPKPQSSFLHNNSRSESSDPIAKSEDYESTTISSEEETTMTNPIYTPTEDNIAAETMDNKCRTKPKIPTKPSNIANKTPTQGAVEDSDKRNSSVMSDNVYDAVEYPNNGRTPEDKFNELDVDNDSCKQKQADERSNIENDVSRQRNGSNKRQAPLPPKNSGSSEVAPVPLPPKKSQRHSLTFANLSSTPSRGQTKSKSNSLGNFNRIKLPCSHQKDEKESKSKKGKFWKMILNKFGKEDDDCCKDTVPDDPPKTKIIKSSSLEITNPKKVKLEIIHPIDFEHSGGPQIIESPAITTAEDGLPSVIDCSSPASSICSGMDGNATSSDSGGNYESVGEDEDSSTGHNGYGSHDEQSSDYFEASHSDSSTGAIDKNMSSRGLSQNRPMPPTRSRTSSQESTQHPPPMRPPPPKLTNSTRNNEPAQSPSANALDSDMPCYANAQEIELMEGSYPNITDDESKRRRAPAPPSQSFDSSNNKALDEPTYQNLNEVQDTLAEESTYYESFDLNSTSQNDKRVSSPAGSSTIDNNLLLNDTKSTDSGFIDYSKSTKQKKKQNDGHLYEKIESNQTSSRSASPHDSVVKRERNSSGFSNNSFKIAGKKLAALTLEENYGNIVCTNHETLACVLENVQRVKPSHSIFKHSSSLKWSDFKLLDDQPLYCYKKSRIMLRARFTKQPESPFILMVSKDGLCLSPPGNSPFIIHPLVQFNDLVPAQLFASSKDVDDPSSQIQASIWVLDDMNALSIPNLFTKKDIVDERQVYFVMLQLITALKFLQSHGIEELDSILDNFLVNTENNHLFIFGDSSVQPQHLNGHRDVDTKLSLCHAAIAAMLHLLSISPKSNVIDEKSLNILESSGQSEFLPVVNILIKEKAVSLSQAKSTLEYMLWGPPESSFDRQEFCTPEDLDIVIQRWLDQERASFLSSLIRTANNSNMQSIVLSAFDEYKLIFLVRTSAKILREASIILEPEVTNF